MSDASTCPMCNPAIELTQAQRLGIWRSGEACGECWPRFYRLFAHTLVPEMAIDGKTLPEIVTAFRARRVAERATSVTSGAENHGPRPESPATDVT